MLVLIFCHITFDLSLSFENDHNKPIFTNRKKAKIRGILQRPTVGSYIQAM